MDTPARTLSDAERLDWLRLSRSEGIGAITFFALLRHFGTAAAAIAGAPDLARRGGRSRPIRIAARADAEREMAAIRAIDATAVAWGEPGYPAPLAAVEDAPPLLIVRGHAHLLQKPAVAVVGARNASAAGCKIARDIAAGLGAAGFVVVSGMARGIDAAAHAGALEAGTVAAMAGGVDVVYPQENAALYDGIVARGAAVSEHPPGTQPTARHFPPRNRIVSGLSLGTVVVEAAPRSGSLITARLALEQGREVFAVPGSPLDPRSRGTNDLIRKGATLVETADDVVEVLRGALHRPLAEPNRGSYSTPGPTPDEQALVDARVVILNMLSPAPVTVDELIRQCQLSPPIVATVLLELELAGRLDRRPGNRVALIP